MRKLIMSVGAAAMLSSGPAIAQPVYLTCTLTERPTWIMDVQLNEASGTASIHYRHGGPGSITRPAAFASDRVSFANYIISRHDMNFTKDNHRSTIARIDKLPLMEKGKCVRDERERRF